MGEILHLLIARAPLAAVFEHLRSSAIDVWALTPRPDATTIGTMVHAGVPRRLALVLGAEGPGLSDGVLSNHANVRIPMAADVDSLNVGHAIAATLAIVQSSGG
jgi:tRNA G18 (ribose-2'-O)-methylase SpoU